MRSSRTRASLVLAAVAAAACGASEPDAGNATAKADGAATASAVTSKQAVQLLLRNHDIPLGVDASCDGVGTDLDDATIGDYLSGFLIELGAGTNAVTSTCTPLPDASGRSRCNVRLAHADAENEWRWGVRFDVETGADGPRLIRDSMRCTGAG